MATLEYSTDSIWWNKGNEFKPNVEEFKQIKWKKGENFTISYVDELTIKVIVPISKDLSLIKVYDNRIWKYYYLKEVLNRTSQNSECLFELDIWTTYIMERDMKIYNTRTLDYQQISNNVPPTIMGLVRDKPQTQMFSVIQNPDLPYGSWVINKVFNFDPVLSTTKFSSYTLTTYAVFEAGGEFHCFPLIASNDKPTKYSGGGHTWYSASNLNLETTKYLENGKTQKEEIQVANADYWFTLNYDLLINRGFGNLLGFFTGPSLHRITQWSTKSFKLSPGGGFEREFKFIYFRLNGLTKMELLDIDFTNQKIRDYNYLGITNPAEIKVKQTLDFVNGFVIMTKTNTYQIGLPIPIIYDEYKKQMAQMQSSINAGYATAGLNFATSILGMGGLFKSKGNSWESVKENPAKSGISPSGKAWYSEASTSVTRTTQTLGGSPNFRGIIGAATQFTNTMIEMEAKFQDMRKQLQTTQTTSEIVGLAYQSKTFADLTNEDLRNIEFMFFTMDEYEFFNKFYGWETAPYEWNIIYANASGGYVKLYESTIEQLILKNYNEQSPVIIEAIKTLLLNGIRVGSKNDFK